MDRVLRVSVGLLIVTLLPLAVGAPVEAQQPATVDWGDLSTEGLEPVPDTPDPTTPMVFLLGLRSQQDRAAIVRAVSDPRSVAYGDYRDVPSLVQQVAASTTTVEVVQAFFAGEGLEATIDPTRTYAQVVMELADAERIFSTTWSPFAYPDSSMFAGLVMLYPTSEPTLPAPLGGLVDRVHGAVLLSTQLSAADAAASAVLGPDGSTSAASPVAAAATTGAAAVEGGSPWRTGTPSGCADALALTVDGQPFGLSPSQILDAYGIDDLHAAGLRGEGMRVAIVENQRYEPSNLAAYRACFGLDDAFPVISHEQGQLAPADDVQEPEAILDLAVMSFVAPKLDRVDLFMTGDDPALAAADPTGLVSFMRMFAAPLDAAVHGAPAPHVVSASYGMCETAPTTFDGMTALAGIFDQVFALAAAAGISYVVSTGDDGSSACNQFAAEWGEPAPEQAVQYPATSPYVTALGGTNLDLDADNEIASSGVWNDTAFVPISELAANPQFRAGGTGGVSTLTGRPWFQDQVNTSPARSVPDVAMFADELPGYLLYTDGWTSVGGTSAAAPLFAGVTALLDQRALATQQPMLGLVAPLMYELGAMGASSLLDITVGDNIVFPEPEYGLTCCSAGPGYDLATGWGSPLADRLLLEIDRPAINLVARQLEPGGTTVELAASMASGIGAALRFEWDVNGDGTIDEVTDTPSITVDVASGVAPAQAVTQDATAVLGSTASRSIAAGVVVHTSLGRTGMGATSLSLSSTAAPAALAFVG